MALTDALGRTQPSAADAELAALVPDAAAGDRAAFTRLVAACNPDMARVAFVVSGGDRELALDAVQSAWVIAWSRLRTLRDPARVRAWLMSVAANQARTAVRRQHRITAVRLEHAEAIPDANAMGGHELDLAPALARLKPEERVLLGLRYVAGLDSREIGWELGISASGVRSRLDRLLDRLRTELGDE